MGKRKTPGVRLPKINQLSSGAWHTRAMIDGQRISITRPTYDECAAEYLALKARMETAADNPARRTTTLKAAVEKYIDARRGKKSPSTICAYVRYLNNTFQKVMGRNVFTASNREWQAAIDDEKALGRSAKYISNAWGLMAAAIETETGKRPDVMLFPKERKERPFLTPEQIDIFVEAIKGTPVEIPALLCLSSLRRSEMLALKWENVDLNLGVLYIRGAMVSGENGMELKPQTKTATSRRAVPIIPPLRAAMEEVNPKDGLVVNCAPITILRHINRICRENSLPEVGLHGLRHSFASLAYHLGIPEMIAAEIGGWADIGTMRKIYTHLAEADIAARSRDFVNFFSRSTPSTPSDW